MIKSFYEGRTRRLLWALRRVTRVQRAVRCFVAEKELADRACLRAKAFKGLKKVTRKQKLLKQREAMMKEQLLVRTKKEWLKDWRELSKKRKALRHCEQVSLKIDRCRVLSKFLALWLRKLHLSLKKKHMVAAQQKFWASKTKERVMAAWARAYHYQV